MEAERQRKRQETNLKKYGVKYPVQVKEIAKKISETVESRTSEERIKITKKRKATNLKKYGVEFAQQLPETQGKAKNTCLKNYGVENPSYSEECKEKRKQTHLKKFGVGNAFQSEIIKEKIKQTNLKKYGVDNPSQAPVIMDKKVASSYLKKKYILPSGKIELLQGYENFTMDELLEIYNESEIIVNSVEMPEIWYQQNNKKHRYFPDFYIPGENKIIEVKSDYTMQKGLVTNLLKKARCIEMGFNFEFRIYDNKMKLIDEKEFLI